MKKNVTLMWLTHIKSNGGLKIENFKKSRILTSNISGGGIVKNLKFLGIKGIYVSNISYEFQFVYCILCGVTNFWISHKIDILFTNLKYIQIFSWSRIHRVMDISQVLRVERISRGCRSPQIYNWSIFLRRHSTVPILRLV